MIQLKRCSSGDKNFAKLVGQLDADLAIRDGDDHDFYHQFNSIAQIKYAVVAYEEDEPVGCGAIKQYDTQSMEVKRMYVPMSHRSKGIATLVLSALENWAAELGVERCILETGRKQPEAISLYKKRGYSVISNYGQYEGVENSICFEKQF